MSPIEVAPGAEIGLLKVLEQEGRLNGEITWRCEDYQGRNVVFAESLIVAQHGATVPEEPVDEELIELILEEAPEPEPEPEPEPVKKKGWLARLFSKTNKEEK